MMFPSPLVLLCDVLQYQGGPWSSTDINAHLLMAVIMVSWCFQLSEDFLFCRPKSVVRLVLGIRVMRRTVGCSSAKQNEQM